MHQEAADSMYCVSKVPFGNMDIRVKTCLLSRTRRRIEGCQSLSTACGFDVVFRVVFEFEMAAQMECWKRN
jgi:hypothetical protein